MISRMMHDTATRTVSTFLQTEFSRIGKQTADVICKRAGIEPAISPRKVTDEQVVSLVKVIKETKLTRPPTDCLSALGEDLIISGLKKEMAPEYLAAVTRPPSVYRGWPFQVEVGIAYGGSITEPKVMRFANRVPLLYQAGDCAMTKSIMGIDWKRYGIDADKAPTGPVTIFVHMFSVWVPFTSESKEAIASYPAILKEVKLALQEAARKMQIYLGKKFRSQQAAMKKEMFKNYSEELAQSLSALTGKKKEEIYKILMELAEEMYKSGEIGGEDGEPVVEMSTKHKKNKGEEMERVKESE
jgi:DNA topoisomerase-6 subunit B